MKLRSLVVKPDCKEIMFNRCLIGVFKTLRYWAKIYFEKQNNVII